jgi:hypothetical protein
MHTSDSSVKVAFYIVACLCFLAGAVLGPWSAPAPYPYSSRLMSLGLLFFAAAHWLG